MRDGGRQKMKGYSQHLAVNVQRYRPSLPGQMPWARARARGFLIHASKALDFALYDSMLGFFLYPDYLPRLSSLGALARPS